jgi:hypothetical protein
MKTLKHIFTITFVTLCTTLCVDTNISAMKRGADGVEASSSKRRKISKKQEALYKQKKLETLYNRGIKYFNGEKKDYKKAYECLSLFLDQADEESFAITQIIRARDIVSHITSLFQQYSESQQSQQTNAPSSSSSSTSTIVQVPVGGFFASASTSAFAPVITNANPNASTSNTTSNSTSTNNNPDEQADEQAVAILILQSFLAATQQQ